MFSPLPTNYTVSAKFNRTRVQTAPVTLLNILQTRKWYQSKELEILLQKHNMSRLSNLGQRKSSSKVKSQN